MKCLFASLIACSYFLSEINAQSGVNISPTPIPTDPSAILNVQSQNQGVLLPRTVIGSIADPTDGLIVFDTVLNHYMFFDQGLWTRLLKESAFAFYYADRDGDGHGDPYSAVFAMSAPEGYVTPGNDCDDTDPAIFEGNAEICDGIDNDCDDVVDDLPDNDGDGYNTCTDCDDTNPDVNPGVAEVCSNGIDDNCDGNIDESPDNDMDGFSVCAGDCDDTNDQVYPGAPELCDELDNDCDPGTMDGIADPQLGQACDGPDADLCAEGIFSCIDGVLVCSDQSGDNLELCDGADNDCNPATLDGSQDPGLGFPCDGPDADLCMEGVTVCSGGSIICSDMTGNSEEICGDEIDNDCDGQTDETCLTIDWCNLQFPASITINAGASTGNIYGQIFVFGVTEAPGQGAGIIAEVGYGPDGSDPTGNNWTWFTAVYNIDVMDNDEYVGSFTVNTAGSYDYAYRFSGDTGNTWTYGDLDGSNNGYSTAQAGDLLVE